MLVHFKCNCAQQWVTTEKKELVSEHGNGLMTNGSQSEMDTYYHTRHPLVVSLLVKYCSSVHLKLVKVNIKQVSHSFPCGV